MVEKKKPYYKTWHIVVGIIVLFLLYIFTFVFWRPFDNEITQDRPIMKTLCQMQVACGSGYGHYNCASNDKLLVPHINKLEKYIKNFNGCNNSTRGYGTDGINEWIVIETCGCGGLM